MLKRIDPLRNELKDLETQAQENEQKAEEVNKTIAGLEKSIAKYKEEYALLISQAQAIKTDLNNVEAKVGVPLNVTLDRAMCYTEALTSYSVACYFICVIVVPMIDDVLDIWRFYSLRWREVLPCWRV